MKHAGTITVAGKTFAMEAESGIGLIPFYGKWTLVEFSCPLESMPPQGCGTILGQAFDIKVVDGSFVYNGRSVALGRELP